MAEPATQVTSKSLIKVILRIIGILISIASLTFVGFSIHRSFADLTENVASGRFFAYVATSSLIYAFLVQLIGVAWHQMMTALDHPPISFQTAMGIFNRSNVYKYLPGNVFHMVGRYALAKTAGASHSSLAFSQIAEIALLVISSMLVALAFSADVLIHTFSRFTQGVGSIGISLLVVMGAILVAICVMFSIVKLGRKMTSTGIRVLGIYLVFFVGSGLLAATLTASVYDAEMTTLVSVIGIASTAWLSGFIIPGAPGGLGPREAVMIAGLTAIGIPPSSATAVAIGHRIATIIGDSLAATVEFAIRTRVKAEP